MTNALLVHRMALSVGGQAVAPAGYVRAADLKVERLEQTDARVTDESLQQRFDYAAPAIVSPASWFTTNRGSSSTIHV